nr:MAG TPA_asm: fist Copper fist DNA binding domain [Caudoviricetes sp.]
MIKVRKVYKMCMRGHRSNLCNFCNKLKLF